MVSRPGTAGPGPLGPGAVQGLPVSGRAARVGVAYPLFSSAGASFTTVPFFFVHSSSLFTFTQPLPLHSFLPAQAWLPSAEAHSPWPLHELTPEHFTVLPASFLPSAANW